MGGRFNAWFNRMFNRLLDFYERWVRRALKRPALTLALLLGIFVASLAIYPFLGRAFFPQTDAGQFTLNIKVPTGSRIEVTDQYVAKIEDLIRQVVPPSDLKMIVSNIGVVNDFSSLYTTNAGQYTATIQAALNEGHEISSLVYMDRVKNELAAKFPDVRAFFQSGSMVDAILNSGMPAPIDVQVNTRDLATTYNVAQDLARRIRQLPGVGEIYIPQDMNYPAIRLNVDRVHAGELGLSPEGHRRQRHHRLELEYHDRPQLLGRLPDRQRLLPDRPVCRARAGRHPQPGGSEADPSASAESEGADHARFRGEAGESQVPHGNRSLPDSARGRYLRHARRARIWAS